MKVAALEDFLKNQELAGTQSSQVLEKFLLYVKLVQDPLNVFRYMKDNAICTYFPLFWYSMSQYLAAIGDYRNAFLCLDEADQRRSITENQQSNKIINTNFKAQAYRQEILNEIRKHPTGKRRSSDEFLLMSEPFQKIYGGQKQKYETLFNLLETKYTVIRSQKERTFEQKNSDKPKSWLYENYKTQDAKVIQIIQETLKMHENSNPTSSVTRKEIMIENQERLFRSVNTPFKRKDPMRMVKTLDSVEMLKRKRKSEDMRKNNKILISGDLPENFDEDQISNDEDDSSLLVNTMPVGRKFQKKKKQVKFERPGSIQLMVERPRNDQHIQKQDDTIEISIKTGTTKKGILRNKSVEKRHIKQPVFPQIVERSLIIKQTQEKEL